MQRRPNTAGSGSNRSTASRKSTNHKVGGRNNGPVLATSHHASYNHKTFEDDVAIGADLLQYRVVTNFEVA